MLDWLKLQVLALQNFVVLSGRAYINLFRSPHYLDDIFVQMDTIGVGSLPIVLLTGFFSGATITLQMSRALNQYGASGEVGQIVAISLVRELGPVLTAVTVAGRNASGMASELGSMKVTEQIDAMRALGTDPAQKLVTPRLIATAVMEPLLTILADAIGLLGGYIMAVVALHLTTGQQYWSSAHQALEFDDIIQGLLKPFIFAQVISLVGCYYGMFTSGGAQGVGRSTTAAVVTSIVWVFVLNLFIGQFFVNLK
ncbi:MAG TPA: ABC transporter permease [Bryobacteraceae bacterium]|nr:ABC transporter permease [Bryobacteraceae bacterium]